MWPWSQQPDIATLLSGEEDIQEEEDNEQEEEVTGSSSDHHAWSYQCIDTDPQALLA